MAHDARTPRRTLSSRTPQCACRSGDVHLSVVDRRKFRAEAQSVYENILPDPGIASAHVDLAALDPARRKRSRAWLASNGWNAS